jgi:hypothetical protein
MCNHKPCPAGIYTINDGSQIRFWEDTWLDNAPLREQYPALYNIVLHKSNIIATVVATVKITEAIPSQGSLGMFILAIDIKYHRCPTPTR